ncbi:hypothetical protein TMatcc_002676 [Talaromyces marneffei ATCC 18224]|uniref:Uncharacterized protein n=2 Tax=Talaromyces marneffei TaxID=37727 RepID=B6Q294_TALMQ|nr:uncharacterized protein EYB26_002222 [Talaromyces marneffei]EEA28965.1 hypothetical protein PMAA_037470 [Talaromyces marneffei ATCC 18224]KAE8555435.1 hypothetical protein EYB25_000131 [Talaromyces marneffei]QGA14567.1 hypothetical protein EYB26_002222 [Talaromyces marneffei]
MKTESAKGILLRSRMTAWLDGIQGGDESSSNEEDKPQVQSKKARDYTFELEALRAWTYHYRQPILMHTIAYELEFMSRFTYPPADLECTRVVVIHGRVAKHDLETLDYLKHDKPARFQKASAGFEKLYGFSFDKFESRFETAPVEVLGCLGKRVMLKYCSAWIKRPEEQQRLIETCDWIVNAWLQFPEDKVKKSWGELCQTMADTAKAAREALLKD